MWNSIAKSKSFDLLGVAIVIFCAYVSGYLFEPLSQITHSNGIATLIPFGIISVIGSIISLESDRLTARINNVGNWIGLVSIITSAWVDYMLGNKGAIFTYPITFIIQAFAIRVWQNSETYKAKKAPQGIKGIITMILVVLISLFISFAINYYAFQQVSPLFLMTSIVFGMSLIGNAFNAFKLTIQWPFWGFYNLIQFFKALQQGNFANVGKYIYYIINSVAGLSFWFTSNHTNPIKAMDKNHNQ